MRVLLVVVGAVLLAGCSADEEQRAQPEHRGEAEKPRVEAEGARVERARCAAGADNCAAVTGRVLYIERVDPDGDGDAHYVLAGGNVTAPGISAIDVRRHLRPRRLPRIGDLVSAAGPVYEGSYGQRQIEATELHHQRR
jgi:hypothetical protein